MRFLKITPLFLALCFCNLLLADYGPGDPYYQMSRAFLGDPETDHTQVPDVILLGETHLGERFKEKNPILYEKYKAFEEANLYKRDAEIVKMAEEYGKDRTIVVLYEAMSFNKVGFSKPERDLIEGALLPNLEKILGSKKVVVRGWDNLFLDNYVINPLLQSTEDKRTTDAIHQTLILGMRNYSLLQSIERSRALYKNPLIFVVSGAEHAVDYYLTSELFENKFKYKSVISILTYAITMSPMSLHHAAVAAPSPTDTPAFYRKFLQDEVWQKLMGDRMENGDALSADQKDAQESFNGALSYMKKYKVIE